MKKFFILCLMAIMTCSCANEIRKETITWYNAEVLYNELTPTDISYLYINEYDKKGRLVFERYEIGNYISEEKYTYEDDKLKTLERWSQDGDDKKKTEVIWYKDNDIWYHKMDGNITALKDGDDEDRTWLKYLEGGYQEREEHLPLTIDDNFAIVGERYQCIGKIVEKDKYGNWIKAVGKEKTVYEKLFSDDDVIENYVLITRSFIYY